MSIRVLMKAFAASISIVLLAVLPAAAQGTLAIDIYGPGQTQANFVLTDPVAATAGGGLPKAMPDDLQNRISRNLSFLPFLHEMNSLDVLGGTTVNGPTGADIDFNRFQLSKVDFLVTSGWSSGLVQLRAYESFSGRLLVGLEYSDVQSQHLQEIADRFCSKLMAALTGKEGFFTSRIAYSRTMGDGHREIWMCNPTGQGDEQITKLGGLNLSPAWSRDGKQLAFTHIDDNGHALGLCDINSRKCTTTKLKGNSVIGPTFMPSGCIAVTLDHTGQSEICPLGSDLKPGAPLAPSWAIEVSPSFDASGNKMVFTSNRQGNPHIFLLDVPSGQVTRVTYEGKYNTDPSISPDGRLVAFARQVPDGYRIFVMDLETGLERQVTFGPGNDEEPTWGPDGYFLAFMSDRHGEYRLFLTTRHGSESKALETGGVNAKSPNWTGAQF